MAVFSSALPLSIASSRAALSCSLILAFSASGSFSRIWQYASYATSTLVQVVLSFAASTLSRCEDGGKF